MTGEHVRWEPSGSETDDPERIAIREALAFGKALYDCPRAPLTSHPAAQQLSSSAAQR